MLAIADHFEPCSLRYVEPYSKIEREAYREVVYAGTLLSMQVRLFSSVPIVLCGDKADSLDFPF